MLADLDLHRPLPASTDLNFGAGPTGAIETLRLALGFPAPMAGLGVLALPLRLALSGPPVTQPIRPKFQPIFEVPWAALARADSQALLWARTAAAKASRCRHPWGAGLPTPAQNSALWKDKPKRPHTMADGWSQPDGLASALRAPWRMPARKAAKKSIPYGDAAAVGSALAANYRYPAEKRPARNIPWNACLSRNLLPVEIPWGKTHRRLKSWIIPWNQGHRPARIWPPPEPPPYIPPEPQPLCEYQPTPGRADFNFDQDNVSDLLPADTRFEFWCHAPARPLVNRTLIMLPTATLVKLPNREPIEAGNVSLDLDIDSWAWNMSATVPADSLALIQPDGNGPAEIEINLSGHIWNILVESFAESRQFGSAAYTIQGRSPAAYLAAPYAPARTWTQNNIRTSRQLAEEELLNTGWTLDWQTEDWLVPGGVFSYDNLTPLDAIGQIAASIGSVILPHASAKILTIQPRYRFNVWSLSSAANNAVLDTSVLTGLSLDWQPKPKYNGVYAAGQNQGVVVFTKRGGTSGNLLAPQAVDALITTPAAGLERGRQALNTAGNKARVSLSLPLTNNGTLPGLMQPGYVVEIPETVPWKGIVTAVSVSAEMDENGPSFQQQLEIERHYE